MENLRFDAGNDPGDQATAELVAELSQRSPELRAWWAEHRVYQRTSGSKRLHHPVVGDLTVDYETLVMPGDRDHTLFLYSTEAGTSSRQALDLLTSWTLPAHQRHEPSAPAHGQPPVLPR